jgi:uncharacterized protein YuzE
MRWTYDANVGALYVFLRDGEVARQVETADGLIVDATADGAVVGVEILSADSTWDLDALSHQFELTADETSFLHFVACSDLVHMRVEGHRTGSILTDDGVSVGVGIDVGEPEFSAA